MGSTGEQIAAVNGVELCWEGFGERSDPPLLLAHGAGDSMVAWREGLCERLAEGGRFVVRYDSRDAGRSTTYEPGAPQYDEQDLLADAVALIDELGFERVHFAGLSGGGAFAQVLAINHPEKVATLTLLSTTPGEPGPETADLPGVDKRVEGVFSGGHPEPDWADRDAVVDYLVELERKFAGSGGFDADAQREYAGRVFDRTDNLAAMLTNPFLTESDPWRKRLEGDHRPHPRDPRRRRPAVPARARPGARAGDPERRAAGARGRRARVPAAAHVGHGRPGDPQPHVGLSAAYPDPVHNPARCCLPAATLSRFPQGFLGNSVKAVQPA